MSDEPQGRIIGGLGEPEELLTERERRLQLATQLVEFPQAAEDGEEFWPLSDLGPIR